MPVQNKSTLKTNPANTIGVRAGRPSEVTVVPGPAKDVLVWKAPTRPFKKRNREYFSTVAAIVFLLIVILFFIKEWLLIGVIIAFMFVSYVLATVPPEEIVYKITTKGVVIGGKTYKWEWLQRFWLTKKWDYDILHFETALTFPGQLQLVLKGQDKPGRARSSFRREEVKKKIEKYLLFEKPKKTFLDKSAKWLQNKVPLES